MREQILTMLKNTQDYLSGQELCEKFAVSRTAVWKAIRSFEKEGYVIEAVRNRGYRLIASPDILLSEEIKSHMNTAWWGKEIRCFTRTDSTNSEIRRGADAGAAQGLVAIAEEQTNGRGRRGRSWVSPPNENVYLSFLLRPDIDPGKASMITLVAALAAAAAIREVCDLPAQIKWPNDIVINSRKTVGILTEMSTEMMDIQYVIVGIGFNVNQKEFPEEIAAMATSLLRESGKEVQRSRLIAAFGEHFERFYARFTADTDLSGLMDEYNGLLVNKDRAVRILEGENTLERTALGINAQGELLVKDAEGKLSAVRSGEVSVRGLYGYV